MSAPASQSTRETSNESQIGQRNPVRSQSCWGMAWTAVPNIIVFLLLGSVMLLGHHTGWKLPRMADLSATESTLIDDWCSEHLVPESKCIECKDDLLRKPKPYGFCREHGVAECVIHHPELAQSKGEPQIPRYDTIKALSLIARPENNSRNTLHTSRIQFVSSESLNKAGIEVDLVQQRPIVEAISANGELVFNPTRVVHLSAKTQGTVAYVFKKIGDVVEKGETLALIDASQVGQAKSHYIQEIVRYQLRRNTYDRLRPLDKSGAVSQKNIIESESDFRQAEVSVQSAHQALANFGFDIPDALDGLEATRLAEELRYLGIPAAIVDQIRDETKSSNLIPIRTSVPGVVMTSEIVSGEVVDPTRPLFTVADPNLMWLILNVRQEDLPYVRRGLNVKFKVANRAESIDGQVDWISPAVDQQTRTTPVRVIVNNLDGRFQDKTFGTAKIILREEQNAITVPREAIQTTPDAQFVFVRDKQFFDENAPKFFHVRQIRIGARDGEFVELLAGVLPGEVIATKGSNVLLAQLLRSNLGAGCGCHEH